MAMPEFTVRRKVAHLIHAHVDNCCAPPGQCNANTTEAVAAYLDLADAIIRTVRTCDCATITVDMDDLYPEGWGRYHAQEDNHQLQQPAHKRQYPNHHTLDDPA